MKLRRVSFLAFLVASSPLLASAQPELPAPDPAPVSVSEPPEAAVSTSATAAVPAYAPAETTAAPAGLQRPQRFDYLRFGLGFRIGYIGSSGFDTFADSDVLAQASLDATYAFYTRGKLALSAGGAWDVGSRSDGSRGLVTTLTAHRLTVPIEARYYVAPWFNVFAKVAPGANAFYARIEDPSSPATLEQTDWMFAADFSGGASLRLVGTSDDTQRRPRLWVTQEVGYGVTSSHSLRPSPNRNADDVLGSDQSTRLGSLAFNGVFWRTGLALSF